ncbi:MAG: tetratricopeptide repeat protein [Myxococcaceae bacterium]
MGTKADTPESHASLDAAMDSSESAVQSDDQSLAVEAIQIASTAPREEHATNRQEPDRSDGGESVPGDSDWIVERWPVVAEISSLVEGGEIEAARGKLRQFAAPGPDVLVEGLSEEHAGAFRDRVDAIAGVVNELRIQRAFREAIHASREMLLPHDHPDLLTAKQNLGVTCFELGDLAGALQLFENVHDARDRLLAANHPDLLTAKLNVALTRGKLGDLFGEQALEEEVLAARERLLPPDHPDLLEAKENLAATRRELGDLQGALALQEEVLAARDRILPPEDPGILHAKQNLAISLAILGSLADARSLFEEVLASRKRRLPDGHPDLLAAMQNLALTRKNLGDLFGALALEEEVLAGYEELLPADHSDLLAAKLNIGATRARIGDLTGANALFEEVLAVRERQLPAVHPSLLRVKQNLAVTRRSLGDLTGALALEEEVLAAREQVLPQDHPDLLASRLNVASSRRELGDYQGALVLEEEGISALERLLPLDHADLLTAKINLALTRKSLGDLPGALALEEEVLAAWNQLLPSDHPDLLRAKLNLAGTLRQLGETMDARFLQEEALAALSLQMPADHPDVLIAKQNLASIWMDLGNFAGALALEEEALAAWEQLLPSDHPYLLKAKLNIAATLRQVGDPIRALAIQREGLAALERLMPVTHPDLLVAEMNIAASFEQVGDLEGLHKAARSVLSRQIALASSVLTHAPRAARATVLRELGRLELIMSWRDSLEARVGSSLTADLASTLESLRAVTAATGSMACAASKEPALAATRNKLGLVRRSLAIQSHSPPSDVEMLGKWRQELVGLSEQRDRLEGQMRREFAEIGVATDLPSAESIAASLGSGEAFVGMWKYSRKQGVEVGPGAFLGTASLVAFVVTPDAVVRCVELGPAAPLEELAARWRATIGRPIESATSWGRTDAEVERVSSRALRAAVLDPVFEILEGQGTDTVYLVPDDFLHIVPLDALLVEDGSRIGEAIAVRIETSAVRLVNPRQRSDSLGTLVALGGVDYEGRESGAGEHGPTLAGLRSMFGDKPFHFDPLFSTRIEAEYVSLLFEDFVGGEPIVQLGTGASESALVELAPQARYLHVATHGWFVPETAAVSMLDRVGQSDDALQLSIERAQDMIIGFLPETLCGIALAGANHGPDGILTAEELGMLDLTNCELAVLSACETNVGIRRAGQGIQSLQTALHAAGARTAICSLWKVDDVATRRLFEVFYTKLWRDGLGKADALWQAKMTLRDDGRPVCDWAGWVLTGDPD